MLRPGVSLVEFELEPKNGGTLLRLRHSRLPSELTTIHGERWSVYLARLEAFLQRRGPETESALNRNQKL
jgi:hypothetical protein